MKFRDKVDRRVQLDTSDEDWQGGVRFHFRDLFKPMLVGTKYADFVDILWDGSAYGCGNDPHVRIVAWTEGYEDHDPIPSTAKKFYETGEIVDAFAWLAENTA